MKLFPLHLAPAAALALVAAPIGAAHAQSDANDFFVGSTDDMVLEVFELAGVVDPRRNSVGPLLDDAGEPLDDEAIAARARVLRTNLLEDVQRWIEPPLEKEHTLRMTEGGALIAHVPPASARWIEAFARLQLDHAVDAEEGPTLFELETAIYQAPPSAFDPLGIDAQTRLFAPDAPFDPHALNIEVLSAPRLVVFASQQANVSIINQVAYVKEYRHVVVAPGNEEILDPIVDVIEDGVSIDTRVVPLPGGSIGVVLDARITELQRPIETVEVVVREGMQPVQIGVPEVHRIELVTRVRLAPEETILITGRSKHPDGVVRSPFVFNTGKDARELALSVRVKLVEVAGFAEVDGEEFPVFEDVEVEVSEGGARRASDH